MIKKKKKKNIIEERLKDYKKAEKYFEENNMSEKQISDTKKIIKIFELALNKIEEGKEKEIKLEKLPKEIDYEFIYGMSTQERNERFNQVLTKLKEDEFNDNNKLNNQSEEMKKKFHLLNLKKIKKNLKIY